MLHKLTGKLDADRGYPLKNALRRELLANYTIRCGHQSADIMHIFVP